MLFFFFQVLSLPFLSSKIGEADPEDLGARPQNTTHMLLWQPTET